MKEFWNSIQFVFTVIGGWLGYFLGGYDGLLYALVVFMVADYITGVMCAVSDKKLSSAVGFKGICRKVLILMLVGIANLLDVEVIGTGAVLRTAVIFFYLSNEGVSLLENAAHLGLPIPEKLKAILAQLHDRADYDNACVHAFIDGNDGIVYQTLPWNHRGWHGGGYCNNTHIGVEMCEPACIKYTGGSTFTCSDKATAKAVAKRTYEAAVELFAMLCKEYGLNPMADGVIISHAEGHARGIASNHGDPEHLWKQLGMGYTMDGFRKDVKAAMKETVSGTQATVFANLSEQEVIAKVGALFTADQKKSGILASVSLAQFILESGYGKSELAQNANNCFGMKKSLSGNTWSGSVWDGKSVYTKQTKEQNADGSYETIAADFRKYACVEDSIADHSAYLLGAMNGSKKRYEGIAGMMDYKKVVQLIKDGGYATSLTYVEKLCSIIEKWNLTQYDVKETAAEPEKWYRVRKNWGDAKSQKGAYKVLKNAKACADKNEGYSVYDWNGNVVYEPSKSSEPEQKKVSYRVRVSIKNLNIRKGPGTHFAKTGAYTGVGVFTIVAESVGLGSEKGWGKLKSGAGWISLDFVERI